MTTFNDFAKGHSIAHITNGDGVVSDVRDGYVFVIFDRKSPNGRNWIGQYDKRWFELHPGYLFHRLLSACGLTVKEE